eukprot:575308-Amphidinium_carterae.1
MEPLIEEGTRLVLSVAPLNAVLVGLTALVSASYSFSVISTRVEQCSSVQTPLVVEQNEVPDSGDCELFGMTTTNEAEASVWMEDSSAIAFGDRELLLSGARAIALAEYCEAL